MSRFSSNMWVPRIKVRFSDLVASIFYPLCAILQAPKAGDLNVAWGTLRLRPIQGAKRFLVAMFMRPVGAEASADPRPAVL